MTINIAIAGAGFIANIHAMAIRNQEDANLVAVVEKFPDKSSTFSRKYGIKRQHATIEKMLKVGGVDALIVGTPNALHTPKGITALKAGVAVMVAKPMGMNAKEAQRMIETGERSGAQLLEQSWSIGIMARSRTSSPVGGGNRMLMDWKRVRNSTGSGASDTFSPPNSCSGSEPLTVVSSFLGRNTLRKSCTTCR